MHMAGSGHNIVSYVALRTIVLVVVPELILINIKPLQKQWGELQGVEILAAVVVALQFLQFILHHVRFRRRRSHWVIQWGAWASYYVPLPLEALAVGMMLRLQRPLWPVAILFAAGQSDTMAAFSLDDDSQNMRRIAKRALCVAYLIVALLQLQAAPSPELCYLVLEMGLLVLVHLRVSSMAMIPSGDICTVAADVGVSKSQQAQKKDSAAAAAAAAEGGGGGAAAAEDVLRIQDAVVAVGSLESLRSARSGSTTYEDVLSLDYFSTGLLDTCLSAALFLQLLQRYHNPGQRVDISRANLDFWELLSTKNYEQALRLVEVQLSFMYDHFFSAHGSPSSASYNVYFNHWIFKIGFLMHIHRLVAQQADAEHGSPFAFGAIYLLVMLQLCQLIYYLTSDRFLVSYMCHHACRVSKKHSSSTAGGMPLLHMVVLNAIVVVETRGEGSTGWQNTSLLGQYSLLGDLDWRCPCHSHHALSSYQLKAWILDRVVVTPVQRSSQSQDFLSYLLKESSQKTEIHTVLVWNIATWLCAVLDIHRLHPGLPPSSSSDDDDDMLFPQKKNDDHMLAATRLSSYCAYLVAFHPELLTTHHTVATRTFDEAAREAEPYLKGGVSSHGRWQRIMSDYTSYWQPPMLAQGARLARKLIDQDEDPSYRWNILADFWAEMLLHLALSGNAAAHIQHLAKGGGEFITHLWTLLSNAGKQQDTTLIKTSVDIKRGRK